MMPRKDYDDKEKHIVKLETAIRDVRNTEKAHIGFVLKFLQSYIQNRQALLSSDPTKCAFAKFIQKHGKDIPENLKGEMS